MELWTNGPAEVIVPREPSYRDYAGMVYELCRQLADVDSSSPEAVLSQIAALNFDTLRFRVGVGGPSESVPLADGVHLLESSRSALSAAAAATVEPQRVFAPRRAPVAERYMEHVRLAHTERGSFVLTVHSPIGYLRPSGLSEYVLQPAEDELSDDAQLSGRDVVRTFFRAIDIVSETVAAYRKTQRVELFDETVAAGVSSNFCAALAGLEHLGVGTVRVGVALSERLPAEPAERRSLQRERLLQGDDREILVLAADHLKQPRDVQAERLVGYVQGLRRPIGSMTGQASISANIGKHRRNVVVHLYSQDYIRAISAHRRGRRLAVVGVVRSTSRGYVVDRPMSVEVE